jgi:imidazolonepropionase
MDHVNETTSRSSLSDTVATLVPGQIISGLKGHPDARRLIDAGVRSQSASDYNSGISPTVSMPMAMSLACTHMKMSPAETVAAARSTDWALRLADRKGSIEPGKDADLAVSDVKDIEIPYWFEPITASQPF